MTDLLSSDVEDHAIEAEPGCPFCPANGKVDIICDVGGMYLVRAKDETMNDLPDRWLIIPTEHVEVPEDLPIGWGEMLVELTRSAGLDTDFNWHMNIGPAAGQTRPHLHWWALDRSTDDLGKGMNWMIDELRRLYPIIKRLRGAIHRFKRLIGAM